MFSSSPHFYSLCVCTVAVASFATLSSPSWLQLIHLTCRPAHLPSIYSSTQQYFKPSSSPTCRWIIVLNTVDHQPSVSLPACNFLASTLSPSLCPCQLLTSSPPFPSIRNNSEPLTMKCSSSFYKSLEELLLKACAISVILCHIFIMCGGDKCVHIEKVRAHKQTGERIGRQAGMTVSRMKRQPCDSATAHLFAYWVKGK